jgi:hypothetical protein
VTLQCSFKHPCIRIVIKVIYEQDGVGSRVNGLQVGHPGNYGTVPPVPLTYTGTTVLRVLYIVPAGAHKLWEVSAIKSLCKQPNFVLCFFQRIVLDSSLQAQWFCQHWNCV